MQHALEESNMNILFRVSTVLLLTLLFVFSGCSGNKGKASPVTLDSIAVTPANPVLSALGATQQLTATASYSDGSSKDISATVTWSSDQTAVATINASGLATAIADGVSTISATDPTSSIKGSATLTVGTPQLQSIAITPSKPEFNKAAATQQMTATGTYSDGSTQDISASVTWASDDSKSVLIDEKGLATSVADGKANISATDSKTQVTATTSITVRIGAPVTTNTITPPAPAGTPAPAPTPAVTLTSISIAPSGATLFYAGITQQFTATAHYSDSTTLDISKSVDWSSGTVDVATINTSGLATTVGGGTAIISATDVATSTVGSVVLTVALGQGPAAIAIEPTGKFAYSANRNSDNITVFSIDSAGGLTKTAQVVAGSDPYAISILSISPKTFLYVANSGSNNISAYEINATTGALTPLAGSPFATGGVAPWSIATTSDGKFAYVAHFSEAHSIAGTGSKDIYRYTINAGTGVLSAGTKVASLGATTATPAALTNPWSLAVDPTSAFLYVADKSSNKVFSYSINSTNGALTDIASSTSGTNPAFITTATIGGNKYVYTANLGSSDISTFLIPVSGAASAVGSAASAVGATSPWSLSIASGKFLYAANWTTNNLSIFTLNQTTGIPSGGSVIASGTIPHSVVVDPTGSFAYAANWTTSDVYIYGIDQTTGALTYLGKTGT